MMRLTRGDCEGLGACRGRNGYTAWCETGGSDLESHSLQIGL